MQEGRRTLTWAYAFFGCGALSALLGYGRLYQVHTVAASRLVPGTIAMGLMFALSVASTLRVVRDLRYASAPRFQVQVLMGAGISLFLVSVALSLR